MAMTKLAVAQVLVALGSATFLPWNKNTGLNSWGFNYDISSKDPYCQLAQNYPNDHFKDAAPVVSKYCTDYFHISASTIVATAQVTTKITSTVTQAGNAVTVTPAASMTSYSSTQTCFQNTATAMPAQKRTFGSFGSGWLNSWGSKSESSPEYVAPSDPFKDAAVSKACSCFGVDFSPMTTSTSTAIVTSVATVTKASVVTVTAAPASASGGVKTVYVPQSGMYTTTNGTALNNGTTSGGNSIFTEYNGYDFYGNDLARGQCVADKPSEVDTTFGWYEYCVDFNSCLEICSAYNAINAQKGMPEPSCAGITYVNGFCYLKSAVPGNGAPNCNPHHSDNADSAILGDVQTPH